MDKFKDTGVIIGWPKEEAGSGRMPREFVVLDRIFPTHPPVPVDKRIREHFLTGRYRKVFYVSFDLDEDHLWEERT